MESVNREGSYRMKNKPKESDDQKNSENDKSEEFRNFEDFSKRMGRLTREELNAIFEKEKGSDEGHKTPDN